MSLAIAENKRLVAPVELQSIMPSAVGGEPEDRMMLFFEPHPEDVEPSFILAARAFDAVHRHSAAAAVRLAQAEQAVGRTEAAVAAALRALDLSRNEPSAATTLAAVQVLIHSDQAEAAERALARVADGHLHALLQARLLIQRGDLKGALETVGELDTIEALTMRGWLALELRVFSEAVHLFREALRLGGLNPTVLVNLGYAHAALGARRKAIRETKEAQALAPANLMIGLNIVGYHLADGDFDVALRQVRRLREHAPEEIRLAFAEADVHLMAGDVTRAEATLRRARTSALWVSADRFERAELAANLAFLEWRLGRRAREDAKRVVLDELERTDYEALPITALLTALMRTTDEANELSTVCERLAEKHPRDKLYPLRTQLAFLRLDFDEAVQVAVEWAEEEILNPHAAGVAVYLLADIAGDTEAAVSLGRTALGSAGHTEELVNNVAYALALAGELDEADRLLPSDTADSIFMTATRALVDILRGRTERGISGYERAHALAADGKDPELPQLVRANKMLALYRASCRGQLDLGDVQLELPSDWQSRPHVALIRHVAEREGLDLSTRGCAEQLGPAQPEILAGPEA